MTHYVTEGSRLGEINQYGERKDEGWLNLMTA